MKRKFVTGFCLFAAVVLFGMAACSQKLAVRFYTEVSEKVEEPVRLALIADLHSLWRGPGGAGPNPSGAEAGRSASGRGHCRR